MERTRIIEYKYNEDDIKDIRNKLIDIEDMIDTHLHSMDVSEEEIKEKIRELMNQYFEL